MRKYILLFCVAAAAYGFHAVSVGHGIYGDGNGYYSYAHALYFEHKLDFGPIYDHLSHFQGKKYEFSRVFWNTKPGPTGVLHNMWTVGTGLCWIPSLFAVDLAVHIFRLPIDKFNIAYEIGCGITGIAMVIAGLYLLEGFLLSYFRKPVAAAAILGAVFATNLVYFLFWEPALSHQPSFFFICLLLFLSRRPSPSVRLYVLMGSLIGLLLITRLPDIIILLPILTFLSQSVQKMKKDRLKLICALLFGLSLAYIPQILVQQAMYGNLLYNPYTSGEQGVFRLIPSQMFDAFLSVKRGLFIWTPFVLVGIAGFMKKIDREKQETRKTNDVFLVSFGIACIYFSLYFGILSAGFGNRFFLGTLPFLTFGFARLFSRMSMRKMWIIVGSGILWNMLLVGQFLLDKHRLLDGVGLTYGNFLTGQLILPQYILRLIF